MHKWLGFSLFPRNDFRTIRNDELKLFYTMVKRRKVSPVQFMIKQWKEIPDLKGDVGCTSLDTHIAKNFTLRAPSIRAQVSNGRMATSTTISSSHMTKS